MSKPKKILAISILILLLAFVANLVIASKLKKTREAEAAVAVNLKQVESLINNAQTSILYKDENAARDFLSKARAQMPSQEKITKANQNTYESLNSELTQLEQKIQKETQAEVSNLGALGSAEHLISFSENMAVQSGGSLISYNLASGKIQDGQIKANDSIFDSVAVSKTKGVIYNGSGLKIWDAASGQTGEQFSASVPAKDDFAGLAFYPTNSRVYAINKKTGQIINFLVAGGNISSPVIALNDPVFKSAQDLAIDGAIYVLTDKGISKFQSGKPAEFKMTGLIKPFSGKGKIYADKDSKNIYLLDSGNSRILILDKKGALINTLLSKDFSKMTDFTVDEKNKVIYVLNDASLLKVTLP